MTDLENNQKISQFMNDKFRLNDINEQINQRRIQIDDLIHDLNGKKFSYERHNYHIINKPFFDIDSLRTEIKHFEPMLNRARQQLKNSEAEAKGLEWIV